LALVLATTAGADQKEAVSKLYVTNSAGDSIHVIDLGSFKVIDQIRTGGQPHGAAVSADGRHFFTTVETDHTLRVIDTTSDQVIQSVKLSGLPNQCAVTPNGRLVAVPIRGGDCVDIVDITAAKVVKSLPVKAPHNSFNAQRNDHAWVTSMGDNKVKLIDLNSFTYLAEVAVGGIPRPLAVTRDERILYCQLSDLHGFVIANVPDRKVIAKVQLPPLSPGVKFPVPHTPSHGLALTPDEQELWATSCGTDTVYIYHTARQEIVGKVRTGSGPAWLAFSPDGRYCCVSNVLGDDVSIIDAAKRREVARIKVGKMPKRLVVASVPK
jgi:YVTN family beta-propeller protein